MALQLVRLILSSVALLRDLTLDSGDGFQRAISARPFRRSHPENPLRDLSCVTRRNALGRLWSDLPLRGDYRLTCGRLCQQSVSQVILIATFGVASISRIVLCDKYFALEVLCYKTLPQEQNPRVDKHRHHSVIVSIASMADTAKLTGETVRRMCQYPKHFE